MQNKIIGAFVILLLGIIILMVVMDISSSRFDKMPENKYELDMDSLKGIGEFPISHNEIKQINISSFKAKSIDVFNDQIYIANDSSVRIINDDGKLITVIHAEPNLRTLKYSENIGLILVYKNYFTILDSEGNVLTKSKNEGEKSVFTSIACYNDSLILIADAGKRLVHIYDTESNKQSSIKGFYKSDNDHLGFIVPSPYFDLIINSENEIWVVNPGIHAIQQYNLKGDLLDFWKKESNAIDGFTGCCNPAHIAVLKNGNIITSEKGLVRIKVYNKRGDLQSVVVPPKSFTNKGQAPDIAVFNDKIYALDFDKKLIRIFKRKSNE